MYKTLIACRDRILNTSTVYDSTIQYGTVLEYRLLSQHFIQICYQHIVENLYIMAEEGEAPVSIHHFDSELNSKLVDFILLRGSL